MKKQSVVKKVVSLVLGLVFSMGLMTSAFAETGAIHEDVIKIGGDTRGTVMLRSDGTAWYQTRWGSEYQIFGLGDNVVALTGQMALKSDGTVWVWETFISNWTTLPLVAVQLPNVNNVIAISTETILKADGTVWVVSFRLSDELDDLGDLDTFAPEFRWLYVTQVPNLSNIVEISRETALKDDGTVWVWWNEDHAEHVPGISDAIGVFEQMAMTSDGRVWTWNIRDGHFLLGPLPREGGWGLTHVASFDDIVMYEPFFALRSDGTVWIYDSFEGLIPRNFRQVPGLHNIVSITNHMALDEDGRVWDIVRTQATPPLPTETPTPSGSRLIQEGFTPPPGTEPLQADTCMSLGNRSISAASGAFVMDFINANTGQLYDFHDELDGFSVIIKDANGQTTCLHLGVYLAGVGRYIDFWVGNLITPITFYYLPVPYGYEVVRIMDIGDFSTLIGVDNIIHARVYVQPIAN